MLPAGPFTRREAEGLGITRGRLRAMVADGSVRRVLSSVYAAGDVPETLELRVAALGLIVGPDHIACDRTAAWIHGVDLLSLGESPARARPEVCVVRGRAPSERPEVRSRSRDLARRDVVRAGGLLVTTPLRTALDIGCILRRRDALAAMDRLGNLHGVRTLDLLAELPRFRRRRGVLQLRELIPLIDVRAESPAETWTRLAIHDAGLPAPVSQWEVYVDGRVFRLDFAYPERLLAVEYDGTEFHSDPADVERDRERRDLLRRAGWRVIVVARDGLTAAGSTRWLSDLRGELARDPVVLRW